MSAFALSINVNGKDAHSNITIPSETINFHNINDNSYLQSSDLFYAGRTISYLLNTRKINVSAAFCLSVSSSKDNNQNKIIMPVIEVLHQSSAVPKIITGMGSHINHHPHITLSKSYYIIALEKIVI